MHELSIALSLLDLVAAECERRGDCQVLAVHLKLGPLAGVVKEALVSAYDLAREGSAFAQTDLVVEDVPLEMSCERCQATRRVRSLQDLVCEQCGAPAADIVSGRELEVVALEILP